MPPALGTFLEHHLQIISPAHGVGKADWELSSVHLTSGLTLTSIRVCKHIQPSGALSSV